MIVFLTKILLCGKIHFSITLYIHVVVVIYWYAYIFLESPVFFVKNINIYDMIHIWIYVNHVVLYVS